MFSLGRLWSVAAENLFWSGVQGHPWIQGTIFTVRRIWLDFMLILFPASDSCWFYSSSQPLIQSFDFSCFCHVCALPSLNLSSGWVSLIFERDAVKIFMKHVFREKGVCKALQWKLICCLTLSAFLLTWCPGVCCLELILRFLAQILYSRTLPSVTMGPRGKPTSVLAKGWFQGRLSQSCGMSIRYSEFSPSHPYNIIPWIIVSEDYSPRTSI